MTKLTKACLLGMAVVFSFPAFSGAMAETFSTSGTSAAQVNSSQEGLATKYSVLFGSDENAQAVIQGLSAGTPFLLADAEGGSVIVTPPTHHMGYGNVNIALALADSQLVKAGIDDPSAADLKVALTGGSIGDLSLPGILTLRSRHMGWGQIAKSSGLNLGRVMRRVDMVHHEAVSHDKPSYEADASHRDMHRVQMDTIPRVEPVERPERVEIPHVSLPGR